ncbi:MAG TPA: hypothetical protein VH083_28590, partial [Myxococcales bacterium]|nr:hypothetical protein [Myxococcales bacterium]
MRRPLVLLIAMALAVASVGALARWDSARESAEALEDFGSAQATLAASIASNLSTRLEVAHSEQELLAGLSWMARPNESLLLVSQPSKPGFVALDGRRIASPPLQ